MNFPFRRELPPSAGLPLRVGDFWGARADLGQLLGAQWQTPSMQLECSGTAALCLALSVLRQRTPERRNVVIPAYTCPLVPIAIHSLGLQVCLCDLAPGHFDMDPRGLDACCDQNTLAVIPTHLGGRVADVAAARRVAKAHGAYVIEDAAQALGAQVGGASVGLQGDVGFFSLAAGKGLSLYEGGLLVSAEAGLRQALSALSRAEVSHGGPWEWRRCLELLALALCYRPALLGPAYGWPLRRALQRGQLEQAVGDVFSLRIPRHKVGGWRQGVGGRAALRLPAFLAEGRLRAQRILSRLQAIQGLGVYQDGPDAQGVWPLLMLSMPNEKSRDAALQSLWTAGLGVSRMFIHALPDYAYLQGVVPDCSMPHAQAFAARTLTLGNSAWLTEQDLDRIGQALAAAIARFA